MSEILFLFGLLVRRPSLKEVTLYSSLNVDYIGQGWAPGIRIPPNVNDLHRTMTMGGKGGKSGEKMAKSRR